MSRPPMEILLVESRKCDADLYLRILQHRWPGARLTWLTTLAEAMEFLSRRLPDAVLLDLQLPDSNGLQALDRLLEVSGSAPIIVLTELNDEPLGLQAIKMGAQDYLVKLSTTGDALERCLNYAIERKRLVSSIRQRDAELAHLSRLITVGELASGLAHELGQPLTAIKNFAQASINRLRTSGTEAAEKVIENLAAIDHQVFHASHVIEHIREFVQKSTPEAQSTPLEEIICDCLSLLDHEVRAGGVDVFLQLDMKVPPVWVDRVQMKQVVVNLIRNAIDAVSSPGAASREIHVQTIASGDREAVVIVSDTGPGFDPETEARLFEPFFSTKHSGMGMGLAICRSIVEAHGGSMHARRLPHGGAEFRIFLPLSTGLTIPPTEIPENSSGNLQMLGTTETATSLANSE